MGGSQKGDGRLGEKRRGRKKLRESDVLQEQRCNMRVYARTPPADSLKCQPQIFQSFMAPEVPLRKKTSLWLGFGETTGVFARPELFRCLSPGGKPLLTHTKSLLSFVAISSSKFSLFIGWQPVLCSTSQKHDALVFKWALTTKCCLFQK